MQKIRSLSQRRNSEPTSSELAPRTRGRSARCEATRPTGARGRYKRFVASGSGAGGVGGWEKRGGRRIRRRRGGTKDKGEEGRGANRGGRRIRQWRGEEERRGGAKSGGRRIRRRRGEEKKME